jgi:hypothetical protein
MLCINFAGYSGKDFLEPVSWQEFFAKFAHRDNGAHRPEQSGPLSVLKIAAARSAGGTPRAAHHPRSATVAGR